MKLNYLVLVLLSVFISACSSTKYAGKKQPELVDYACSIKKLICGRQGQNIKVQYQVKKINANTYVIEGFAIFSSSQEYSRYDTVENMSLEFAFLNKDLAVHEEKININGVIGKKMVFKKEFTSLKVIDSSILADTDTFIGLFG